MINIEQNIDLKSYNTFGVSARCRYFSLLEREEQVFELVDFLRNNPVPVLILGNGSNILFINNFDGLIILNCIKGKQVIFENEECVFVEAGGGESWNDFVKYSVGNGWGGIENLANIPGTVGASAVQNIGAYDMEAGNVIFQLTAYNLKSGEKRIFIQQECVFGYRTSVFKNPEYQDYIITHVTYLLNKKPVLKTSYKAISDILQQKNISNPTLREMYEIVFEIRQSKLPDEKVLPNAGSFFKNPVVNAEKFGKIKQQFPEIISYPLPNSDVKLAAGWLIEQCGLKGLRQGNVGVHDKQALVLVNYGSVTGMEIWSLAQFVIQSVQEKFGVLLESEVIVK